MNKLKFNLTHLRNQLLLSFIIIILLTAAAIGLPALWLMRDQLNQQAWAQVDQGSQATYALYVAQQNEMQNLATLTAERPTLRSLLSEQNQEKFISYLQTLRSGAELDLILVCDQQQQPLAQVGFPITAPLCHFDAPVTFQILADQHHSPQLWLLATHPLEGDRSESLGSVIVGITLADSFASEVHAQTGLEHTLLWQGQTLATSFTGGVGAHQTILARSQVNIRQQTTLPFNDLQRETFNFGAQPFFANRFHLIPESIPGLEIEVALPVDNILATRQQLAWILLGAIIGVTALGSGLGLLLTRRISQPLARLTKAATKMSQGNLTISIPADPRVQEVALVAYALEAARLDLQLTLNDLRREKAWSNHLLESIVEGIVTLDERNRVIFFSQGAEHITGWQRETVRGRSCDEIFTLINAPQPFSQILPNLERRTKIMVALPDGRQSTLAFTGAKLTLEGQPAQTALVFRDVSEEEMMHRLVGHFLANIAHEFRTPLSALAASVELLLDQAPDLSQAELQELLTSLHLGVLGLQTLIDNLLESASIEAGRFRVSPRPCDLGNIIGEVTRTIQPLLAKRGQCLQLDLPSDLPPVQADPRRTAQVLTNLLSNASKYSPDETEIIIGASQADSCVRVTVADCGPGIPPEYRTDLFRLFMRGRATEESQIAQGGTGLGLSVVKAIVEAQGGEVGVEDRLGQGAIFWFTLPVASP